MREGIDDRWNLIIIIDSPYSNSRNPIFNIRNGFRSYTPLKENYFKGSTHPNEVRDYKSYIKTKEREFGILSSLKRKQKKLIDRLSPPRDHCKSRLENTQDEIDINKIVR